MNQKKEKNHVIAKKRNMSVTEIVISNSGIGGLRPESSSPHKFLFFQSLPIALES